MRSSARTRLLVVPLLATLVLAGCGGGDDAEPEQTPDEVMAEAKANFDEAGAVRIDLATDATPESGNGVLGAEGVLTDAPAFEGDVRILLNSLAATVPVVAVDGDVFAQIPLLGSGWTPIDPVEYGAPDPAGFADPETGLSSLLTQLDGLEEGQQTRDGESILTTYTGELPGSAVAGIIPSADPDATFPTVVGVDEDGFATSVRITGPFFGDGSEVRYDVDFSGYGDDATISAPE